MKISLSLSLIVIGGLLLSGLSGPQATFYRILDLNPTPSQNEFFNSNQYLQDFNLFESGEGWILFNQSLFRLHPQKTWQDITPKEIGNQVIRAVDFLDSQDGWLVSSLPEFSGDRFSLWQTSDGGNSWRELPLSLFSPGDPQGIAANVYLDLVSSSEARLVIQAVSGSNFSLGTLFHTRDGAKTWNRMPLPLGEPVVTNTPDSAWQAGGPNGQAFYHSTDGGNTWQAFPLPITERISKASNFYIQVPSFSDNRHGLILIQSKYENENWISFLYTVDGGITWHNLSEFKVLDASFSSVTLPLTPIDSTEWLLVIPGSGQLIKINLERSLEVNHSRNPNLAGTFKLRATAQQVWVAGTNGNCQGNECTLHTMLASSPDLGESWSDIVLPDVPLRKTSLTKGFERIDQSPGIQITDLSRTLTLQGQGFDKCEIPTISELSDWFTSSPYKVVNLYIGGKSRACSNTPLTGSYLQTLTSQGWRFIPTWVGYQATCTSYYYKIPSNTTDAYNLGVSEANAAIEKAASLGLTEGDKTGSVIYYDLEPFDVTNSSCVKSTQSFIKGWSKQVRSSGNLAGLYSTGSVLNEISKMASTDQPDVIWPAHWIYSTYNANATVWNVYNLSNSVWADHQRIRQYAGGHNETWGLTTLKIDSNVIDGVTADISGTIPISILKDGNGSGTITSAPAGIDCGTICFSNYDPGTQVTLTAQAAAESTFQGWGGGCSGTGTCQVTLNTAQIITATFILNTYPLDVTKDGNGSGTVSSNPSGIDCGSDCSGSFNYNSKVTLTAIADPGSTFTGWTGDCSNINGNTCEVTIGQTNQVKATFMLAYLLTVSKNGNGTGKVSSSPSGIDCGSDCSEDFVRNSVITLTATPFAGSYFTGWSGLCSSTKTTCQVTLNQSGTVTATFQTNFLFLPFTGKD